MEEYRLTNIKIKGLFEKKNYNIEINENKLVFFDENGAGKTTILNIISAFLSKEWYRLYRYPFEIIECSINERIYSFENKKDLLYDKEKFRNFVRDKGNASTEKSDAIKILEAKSLKFLV
ncbi:MAG TPA: hypothetical protein PL163_17745, partial [Leptospiraceae bacterium]|nr:hypothetical protein [Leptospiraceae bacterium]